MRAAGGVFLGLGVVIAGVTIAAINGHLPGVGVQWPALLVAGVLIVLGLVNLRRPAAETATVESGPIRESGFDPALEAERETRGAGPGRRGRWGPDIGGEGGGSEPSGRD